MIRPTFSPFLILVLGSICVSFSPIFARMSEVGPLATAFWRMALAAPFLAFVAGRTPSRADVVGLPWKFVFLAAIFFACDLSFWHLSLRFTKVANAALLVNSAPIFVIIGTWLIWKETVSLSFIVCVGITVFGAGMLTASNLAATPTHLLGDGLALLSAIFYSAYFLALRVVREKVDSSRIVMLAIGVVTSTLMLVCTLLFERTLFPETVRGWSIIIALALITQAIGQTLITAAMAQLKTALSSVGLMLQPVIAAAAAWLLFGEALNISQIIGGCIVLLGVYWSSQTR